MADTPVPGFRSLFEHSETEVPAKRNCSITILNYIHTQVPFDSHVIWTLIAELLRGFDEVMVKT